MLGGLRVWTPAGKFITGRDAANVGTMPKKRYGAVGSMLPEQEEQAWRSSTETRLGELTLPVDLIARTARAHPDAAPSADAGDPVPLRLFVTHAIR